MPNSIIKDQSFLSGIRKLDEKHADYLYELRQVLPLIDHISIGLFVKEVLEGNTNTMVFVNQKGKSLRNDIRKEVVALYEDICKVV